MKKITTLLALVFAVAACQNKDLDTGGDNSSRYNATVNVRINWRADQAVPTEHGMRVNIFSLDESQSYGLNDVSCHGFEVSLPYESCHRTLAYSYRGNNIYFRNQLDPELIEAYSNPMVRSTYTRSFPDQNTVSEPQGNFYVGEHASYTVLRTSDPQYIDIHTENKLYTYTFEVKNVEGAQFIRETRGAISGMSSSYFIASQELSSSPATVLFNASVDVPGKKITGSFQTFGRLDATNMFTVEILYPSNTNGIMQETWDVTNQISNGTNFSIVIDNSGIVVPDEGGEDASGWTVDVGVWDDVTVDL